MAKDAVDKIRAAESEAQKIINDAENKARELVNEAKAEAKRITEQAEESAKEAAANNQKASENAAQEFIASYVLENKSQNDAPIKAAIEKKEAAISEVIELLF